MTYGKRLQTVFLCGTALLFLAAFSPSFAQEDQETTQDQGIDVEEIVDEGSILGEVDETSEELSRLVDKSEIADLEFLNAGVAPDSIDQLKAMQSHVASLYERIEPAVVNIRSGLGQGSGVVVTSDGYILTAAHVISVPNRPAVITFPDGSRARAQTLGLNRDHDAGLLRIYEMIPAEKEEDSDDESADEESDKDADEDEDKKDEAPESMEESGEDESDKEEADKKGDDESDEEGSDANEEEDSDEEDSDEEDSDEEESDEEESEADQDKESDNDSKDDETDSEEEAEEEKKPAKRERFKVSDDLPSFNYLEIGDSDSLKLGQWTIAVGHPGGLDEDRGIVLRVGRINQIDETVLRTDCSLVGGDSGGPLIGMDGSVIGIHSRIGRLLRENFHVPSNEFVNNWTALLEPVVLDRDAELNVVFRGESNVIASIPRRSLARRSGLKVSDRIIRVGDRDIYDKLQFDDAISNLKPYQEVEFEVQRKGKKEVLSVVIGEKSRPPSFR